MLKSLKRVYIPGVWIGSSRISLRVLYGLGSGGGFFLAPSGASALSFGFAYGFGMGGGFFRVWCELLSTAAYVSEFALFGECSMSAVKAANAVFPPLVSWDFTNILSGLILSKFPLGIVTSSYACNSFCVASAVLDEPALLPSRIGVLKHPSSVICKGLNSTLAYEYTELTGFFGLWLESTSLLPLFISPWGLPIKIKRKKQRKSGCCRVGMKHISTRPLTTDFIIFNFLCLVRSLSGKNWQDRDKVSISFSRNSRGQLKCFWVCNV